MLTRRDYFGIVGGGITGAMMGAPAIGAPINAKEEESLLEILTKRSPFVFAVEIVSVVKDEIAEGDISLFFQTRVAKALEIIRGKKPPKEFHVSIGYYTKHSGFSAPKGAKLVLFLEPYAGKGVLGSAAMPYVTLDPWFGVMAHSDVLVEELKKLAKS